ncbi:LysR family transcriptional regulator [Neorhizobium alkalisoli]|uniref:HTH-type transcriptional regulator TtuA n=1 Tax=Neorhizobium alkalisoli TaxID=528178 RepID=A0A561R994_9HYPH|nr:LysR family transcriptional regulator [Neorhizobium alkalisoli]TWF59171.1 LysR family nitrogen assimilation transcriptional regulator [Neorhizobium alkalisoli]
MDLRKLRYFVGLVEAGGFRRVADVLKVAQPALTRQIRSLEIDLGVQLVIRSKAGVTLLPAGQTLLEEAREILARVDRLGELVIQLQVSEAAGEVRIGLPSALADTLLGRIVQTVKAGHPNIQIICREGAADAAIQVEEGDLDLAVVSVAPGPVRYTCHFERLLKEQDYMLSRDTGALQAKEISLPELFAKPVVLTPLPNARRLHLEKLAAACGAKLDIVAEAATMSAQLELVSRGLCVAVLPLSAARVMQRGGISMIAVKDLISYRLMLVNRSPLRPVATGVVAEVLRSMFRVQYQDRAGADNGAGSI